METTTMRRRTSRPRRADNRPRCPDDTAIFVERFAPRGRDPAVADENLYRYCDNEPTAATDPTGALIGWIDVQENKTSDGEKKTGDVEVNFKDIVADFKKSNELARKVADQVDQLVDDDLFNKLKAKGKVIFNLKPFPGDRLEFVKQVRREIANVGYLQISGGLTALEAKLRDPGLRNLKQQPYDHVLVNIHGGTDDKGVPDMTITGDSMPQQPTLSDLGQIVPGLITLVCAEEIQAGKPMAATARVWVPKTVPGIKDEDCVIRFNPMSILGVHDKPLPPASK